MLLCKKIKIKFLNKEGKKERKKRKRCFPNVGKLKTCLREMGE